jgi:hypothetical protein
LATVPGQEQESRQKIKEICDAFQTSEDGQQIMRMVQENHPSSLGEENRELMIKGKSRSPYKASWWSQIDAVLWRSWISVIREPAVLRVKAFQTIVSLPRGPVIDRNE